MPEMQEQFPARAQITGVSSNEATCFDCRARMPEMQEHFPAGANFTGVPSNEETCFETPGVYTKA